MDQNNFEGIIVRSLEQKKKYHELELQYHGSKWSVEEDALAYLTDAGLIGRNIMSQEKRWPKGDSLAELKHKLGENIWWLIVLAERSGIDIRKSVDDFLQEKESFFESI